MSSIIGVDEVGRGALAGPLVAAAVLIIRPALFPFADVRDSKAMDDADRRQVLRALLKSCAIRYGIVSNFLIDRVGLQQANVFAIDQALNQFPEQGFELHSDYVAGFQSLTTRAQSLALHIRGESVHKEIAAASIAAKVFRDDLMIRLHRLLPRYNFQQHKGYGTHEHRLAVRQYGLSPVHRRSFQSSH